MSKLASRVQNTEPGKRVTIQRNLLLELLRKSDGHLDALELYRQARDNHSKLSLSTIYRNMRLFKEFGLIEEHQLDGRRRCYETRPKTRHHHLVCLACGQIREFRCPMTDKISSTISKEEGFEITEAEVRLLGYCKACQEGLKNKTCNEESKVNDKKGGERDA